MYQQRDPHGHHEVDCIADLAAAVHSGTVLPGRSHGLRTRVPTVLKRRCSTQRTEVSRSSSSVIADGVSRDHQGGTAERHNDAEDPNHKHRRAAELGARDALHPHGPSPAAGSGTTCARASSGTATIQRLNGRAVSRTVTMTKLGCLSITIVASDGAAALALATALVSPRAA
jgi:hypothetical protein